MGPNNNSYKLLFKYIHKLERNRSYITWITLWHGINSSFETENIKITVLQRDI